ncbi:hypothetical protein [Parvibaculum sedimenti]|uniref:hypothetical protein n=1 Tax=Parvibaculum sedimenti TaxID=2608632 RepID=UPI00163AEB5F|nr:hypothetical protein [Parvibaculum sedimenti]
MENIENVRDELGQVDGSLAHTVERVFVVCMKKGGFAVKEISTAAELPVLRGRIA